MAAKIFRINYKSDFILTLNSDAGWMTPFCIKFWTGAPSQAFFVGWDGETYTHCAYDPSEPTKLQVQFDDHHLPIGDLKFQIAYHFTVADFPNDTEDEVINPANITTEIDGETYQVMLDFTGETAPEIEFSLPAYANEAQRIANEQQRISNEEQRIADEQTRISNEQTRVAQEQTRQQNEAQRIAQESARVSEFASLKSASEAATSDANNAATLANEKAQLADDKAALADSAATQASLNALYAHDEGQLAGQKAFEADQATQLATNEASFAHDEGNYAKQQGDYAKEQGDTALADHVRANADHSTAVDDHTTANNDHTRAESDHSTSAADHTTAGNDHTRAESDHGIAADDHTQAGNDHTRAESDHGIAADDHTTAGNDHTRAESDHTRAESDHAAVEVYVDSLGAFDISAYHATGGVLAEYADLTAALGTNGANIPDALRKGGMSVKFVTSSDHKYVQYRLIADSWSTTPSDWQSMNVDELPTAGSANLVKSGGVYNLIGKATYECKKKVNSSGNIVASDEHFISKQIPCSNGSTITWQYNSDQSVECLLETFDSEGNKIGTPYYSVNGSNGKRTFTISDRDGLAYIIATFADNDSYTPSIKIDGVLVWEKLGIFDAKDNYLEERIEVIETNIDDKPTAGSNNPIKSGGVQNELALGAVYDVSAKNPTAGPNNNGKWESLSALLSDANLNTLIPTAYRKGGMSIKFVQSSDYVQYRLTATAWSTNVSDWQGVDDEPAYGSNNLVKSGGADKAISNLRFFVGNEAVQITSNVSAASRTYTVALGNTIPSGTTFTIKVVADGVLSDSNTFPLYYNAAEQARMITSEAKNNSIITFTAPEDITSILFYTTSSSFVAAGSVSFELKDVNSLSDTVKGAVSDISEINTSLSLLNQNDYCCSFIGIGKDYTSVTVKIPQNTKKFLVVEPLVTTWELGPETLGSGNVFKIEKSTDGVTFTEVYHCLVQNISILTKREVFSFDNCAYLRVGGRAASGVNVYFKIGSPSKDELIENNLIEWNDISPAGYNYAPDLTKAKVGLTEDLQYDSVDNGKILVDYDLTTSSSFNTYTYTLTPGSYNIVSRVGWTAGASYCALYTPDGKHYRLYKEANGYFNRNIFVDHTCKLKIVGQVNNTLPKVSRIIDNSTLGFIGEGNTYVSNDYFNLIPGHRYRINLLNKDYARTEATQKNYSVFTIRCYKSDTTYDTVTINYVGDDGGQAVVLQSNYVFTCPENHSYLQIGGRANFGVIVNCILEDITDVESDTEHGNIGANYPEQTKQIYNGLVEPVSESYISEDGKDRLSFIHISDDHGSGFGRAQELLNISPEQCQFLIDTGDMVVDKLADAYDATKPFYTIAQMNACTKRMYLVLGNHDYVVGNTYTKQDVFDTFITPMNTHNSSIDVSYIATQKSYYSYDYSNSKIKTIMLDMNDGWGAEELSEQTPAGLTYRCKMSGEQINWFIGQLNDAITNSLGVCIFIHRTPATVDKNAYIQKFYDKYISGDYAFNNMSIHFLCDIVQGFIEGTSGNVTHNGSTYQYSFASPGTFIAWFGGHTHYDEVGYLENYPKQFSIQVPRPILDFGTADGTVYSTRKLSIHWNYVTISMARRKLSVLRVGDNDSKYGGKKEGFEVFF